MYKDKKKNSIVSKIFFVLLALYVSLVEWSPAAHAARYTGYSGYSDSNNDDNFLALRDAARRNDAFMARQLAAQLDGYPIPSYVDYYRLRANFLRASDTEIRAFLTRYDGTAIADRLRNDWLLELGRARDWTTFDEQYPLFVLNDDLQVKCYALMSRTLKGQLGQAGQTVADEARVILTAPQNYGDACTGLIAVLLQTNQFNKQDVWLQIRMAAEVNASSTLRRLAPLVEVSSGSLLQAVDKAGLVLNGGAKNNNLFLVALGQIAKNNVAQAVQLLNKAGRRLATPLTAQEEAQAWAQIALPASFKLMPEAVTYWRRTEGVRLSPEGYQWRVRMALREGDWKLVKMGIQAMPATLAQDPAWLYWLGRALKAEGKNEEAAKLFQKVAEQTNFYGQLSLEELGKKITIPPRARAVTADEIAPMASNEGFRRALKFLDLNLRAEGYREWNWELRKMNERQHLAAAEFARRNNALDRMVSTSDRTKVEFDFTQRFPAPFREVMNPATQALKLDMAWVYGLIRQESRFIMNARSHVGASGLMQLMPATAQHVADKIGMHGFSPEQVNDIDVNIALGTNYLNMMLNTLDGSQAMATAAYNAGPGRPRAWRSTLSRLVEGAIFAESIPFTETRNYVKNVLSNATYYAALFENKPQSLKARLGSVGPQGWVVADSQ